MDIDERIDDTAIRDDDDARRVALSARAVLSVIAACAGAVVLLNIALGLQQAFSGGEPWAALSLFDLDAENTIAAWFSSVLLLVAAGLLSLIGLTHTGARARRPWLGLSVLFVVLSADEAAAMHERLIEPLRGALGTAGGAFHFAWVIPGIVFVAVVGALYLPFLRRLPATTRNGFVLGGGLFVAGAIGLEMVMGLLLGRGDPGIATGITSLAEETLELLGLGVFIAALLHHLRRHTPRLNVVIRR